MKTSAKAAVSAAQIQALVDRASDAYSADNYASWSACAAALLRRGYTEEQGEAILRSKITRWAADSASKGYGHATANDLLRYMDRFPHTTIAVLHESGLYSLSNEEWAICHGIHDGNVKNPRYYKRDEVLDLAVKAAIVDAPHRLARGRLRELPSVAEIEAVVGTALNIVIANGRSSKHVASFVADVAEEALFSIELKQSRKRTRRAS